MRDFTISLDDPLISSESAKTAANTPKVEPPAAVVTDGVLTLKYGDINFERKLLMASEIKTLRIDGLPVGIRMSQGVDERGFFFWFTNGAHDSKRYYHPRGLKEIRVNGNFLEVDLERKYLILGYLSRYSKTIGCFMSFTEATLLPALLSYYCSLSEMPEPKSDFLIDVLENLVTESADPYFPLYLCDLTMAKVLKSSILRRYKVCLDTIEESEALTMVARLMAMLEAVKQDAQQGLAKLNCPCPGDKCHAMAPENSRFNPTAFWLGAYHQAEVRQRLLIEAASHVGTGTISTFISEEEVLAALKAGNRVVVTKEFLARLPNVDCNPASFGVLSVDDLQSTKPSTQGPKKA